MLESVSFVYTIFLSMGREVRMVKLSQTVWGSFIKRIDNREEENCNENVKNVTLNLVTISELARLVYDKS